LNTFGDRFKNLRLSKDLTQEQLAEEFNKKYGYSFTKATISQYENNKRTPEITAIMNFVDYFKTSLDYMLCNDEYIIKEISGGYQTSNSSNHIELESILDMTYNLVANGKVKVDNRNLDEAQIHTLKNCFDIALELIKRN
jgi:transcriptional regulator with XRE-family HTH domain